MLHELGFEAFKNLTLERIHCFYVSNKQKTCVVICSSSACTVLPTQTCACSQHLYMMQQDSSKAREEQQVLAALTALANGLLFGSAKHHQEQHDGSSLLQTAQALLQLAETAAAQLPLSGGIHTATNQQASSNSFNISSAHHSQRRSSLKSAGSSNSCSRRSVSFDDDHQGRQVSKPASCGTPAAAAGAEPHSDAESAAALLQDGLQLVLELPCSSAELLRAALSGSSPGPVCLDLVLHTEQLTAPAGTTSSAGLATAFESGRVSSCTPSNTGLATASGRVSSCTPARRVHAAAATAASSGHTVLVRSPSGSSVRRTASDAGIRPVCIRPGGVGPGEAVFTLIQSMNGSITHLQDGSMATGAAGQVRP
jgi:hypothetical protein